MEPVSGSDVAIGIAAASAAASAVSAYSSARSVALSHRPFVVGDENHRVTSVSREEEYAGGVVGVVLRNEGPGLAMEVRFRVRDWEYEIDTGWSASVGSIRPGEQHWTSAPFELPGGVGERELGLSHDRSGEEPNSVLWYIETQFSDIRGGVLARPT